MAAPAMRTRMTTRSNVRALSAAGPVRRSLGVVDMMDTKFERRRFVACARKLMQLDEAELKTLLPRFLTTTKTRGQLGAYLAQSRRALGASGVGYVPRHESSRSGQVQVPSAGATASIEHARLGASVFPFSHSHRASNRRQLILQEAPVWEYLRQHHGVSASCNWVPRHLQLPRDVRLDLPSVLLKLSASLSLYTTPITVMIPKCCIPFRPCASTSDTPHGETLMEEFLLNSREKRHTMSQ